MKKTSNIARTAALLLVLCLVSMVMMGSTFAKYTSEYAGQDTALIAKWNVTPKVGSTGLNALNSDGTGSAATLDLFSHADNTNILATAGTDKIIAPGVGGNFVLDVKNTGDVAAKMTFDFLESGTALSDGKIVPIEYSLDNTHWSNLATLKTNLEALSANGTYDAMSDITDTDGEATATVYWRWPFVASNAIYTGSTNDKDTALGVASASASRITYILKITATATQLEPSHT